MFLGNFTGSDVRTKQSLPIESLPPITAQKKKKRKNEEETITTSLS